MRAQCRSMMTGRGTHCSRAGSLHALHWNGSCLTSATMAGSETPIRLPSLQACLRACVVGIDDWPAAKGSGTICRCL